MLGQRINKRRSRLTSRQKAGLIKLFVADVTVWLPERLQAEIAATQPRTSGILGTW